nr:MAG TPA_asm: hypothetical protein [Bacteriophage sp.]
MNCLKLNSFRLTLIVCQIKLELIQYHFTIRNTMKYGSEYTIDLLYSMNS